MDAQTLQPYRKPGFTHDWFLVSEFVKRDFKSRYDRSALGMFWCILQPSLTMGLLYTVFSVFFKSSIENFPVYLISGVVFHQFFVETTSTALRSIQDNAELVAKVKVPLWTYPVTRAVASLVNFAFALVPLMAVVLATGVPIRPSFLLLAYAAACMLAFALGVGLFLAALAVFFHDIQFLWSFACTLFMYATPVFWPEAAMPGAYRPMLYFNPLYHTIHFARTAIAGSVPPAREFAACAVFGIVSLSIGMAVFRSLKNKFAMAL